MTEQAKQKRLEYMRDWRNRNREKVAAWNKQYRQEHPEVYRESRKRYYAAHREQCLEYQRLYRQKHPNDEYWERKCSPNP